MTKKIIFSALGLIVVIVVIELVSALYLTISSLDFQFSYSSTYRNITRYFDPQQAPLSETLLPHPYFGFHKNGLALDGVNNYGFVSNLDYPYKKKEEEFIIGVFGGSVAEEQASYMFYKKEWRQNLKAAVPCLKGKKLVILNFGLSSSKQPQQYFVFSYFANTVDLSVNIDGLNEMTSNLYPGFPIEYPHLPNYWYLSSETKRQIQSVKALRIFHKKMAQIAEDTLVAFSQTYYLAWKLFGNLIRAQASDLESQSEFIYTPARPRFASEDISKTELYNRQADVWARFTFQQHILAEAMDIPSFYFIQPILYLPGTKPLSPIEKERIKSGYFFLDDPEYGATLRFSILRDRLNGLIDKGIAGFDLRHIFKDVADTVYRDSCCHYNKLGKKILAESIIQHIVSALKGRHQSKLSQICQ